MEGSIPNKADLGKAIRAVRKEDGRYTGEGLAAAAGVDKSHVNRAENHGKNFTWYTLGLIAEALDVPISVLAQRAEAIANSEAPVAAPPDEDR